MSKPAISFEFFPPRSPVQERRFWSTFGALQTLEPEYVSMTWGALGSASQASIDVLQALMQDATVPVAAHLTCIGHSEQSIRETITTLKGMGITRFVALRGDQPQSQSTDQLAAHQCGNSNRQSDEKADSDVLQHASDLVAILAEDPSLDISVGAYPEGHPEARDWQQDLRWLKYKLDQGATRAITQFFFSADTFLRFRDQAISAGITQQLVPGILPIHNIAKVQQFSQECGAHIPDGLVQQFASLEGSEARVDFAVEQCVELIESLHREGVEQFHLYTMNQTTLSYRICQALHGDVGSSVHAAA